MAVKGKKDGLEVIATSMDNKEIKEPEKPTIDPDAPKDVIKYGDRIFEVPGEMVWYFAHKKDVLSTRIKRTMKNGIGNMYPDGAFGCFYCNHYTQNIANLFTQDLSQGRAIFGNVQGEPGIAVDGCTYQRKENVLWVTAFQNAKGDVVMAQKTPCVVYDSLIAEIIEQGLLNEYEVKSRELNYPRIGELMQCPELEKHYKRDTPKKADKPSLVSRIKKLFKKS